MCTNCRGTGRNPNSEYLDCAYCDAATNIAAGKGAAPVTAAVPAGWSAATIAELAGAFGMGPRNAKAFAAKLISEIPRIAATPAAPTAAAVAESQPGALELVPTHEGPDVPKAWAKAVYEGWRAQAGITHDFDAFMAKYGRFLSLENIQSCASHVRGGPAMREALAALSAPAAPVPAASEGCACEDEHTEACRNTQDRPAGLPDLLIEAAYALESSAALDEQNDVDRFAVEYARDLAKRLRRAAAPSTDQQEG